MKSIIYIIIILYFSFINTFILKKIKNSKFSNAELIDDNILVSYNGGISKYSYDFNLISEIPLEELKLNSYSDIHKISTNMELIESSRAIYIISNDNIDYKIDSDSISLFRQVLIIDSSSILVLKVDITTSIINFCLYNIQSKQLIKEEKSSKGYNHYACSVSSLSGNYIVCFLVDDNELYYIIFDSNLNKKVSETKIDTPENELRTNYIYSIQITDTKIILFLIKNNDDIPDFKYKSYLVIYELKKNSETYQLEKIGPQEDFIVYDKTYTGANTFLLKKIEDNEFVIVFPIDETLKDFYFSIFQFQNDDIAIKEGYQNIHISFDYQIQGLKFLKINLDYAISFYYYNNEEVEEIEEIYLSYLSNKKCSYYEISNYINNPEKVEIDLSKFISNELISPDTNKIKIKIDLTKLNSISLFYDEDIPITESETIYEIEKLSYISGNEIGTFEVPYIIYSANDYSKVSCKIVFNILNEEYKSNIELEKEIKEKIKEKKNDFTENLVENNLYNFNSYKIGFYNTSQISQDIEISKEGASNVNLLSCEKILKQKNNIPEHQSLIIMKVELERKDTNSLQVEYEVYSESFKLLDLNDCKNEIIKVSIPYSLKNIKKNNFRKLSEEISLEEKFKLGLKYDYDILNPNSSFYNDVCTRFDTEYSTDLIIEDRKEYYYMPQQFCEDSCTYSSYNISNQKVDCDCYIKTIPKYITVSRHFANNNAAPSFGKKEKNVNFKVFQCLGEGFKNFVKNISVWIILLIFIGFCILSIFAILREKKKNNINVEIGTDLSLDDNSFKEIKLAEMSYDLAIDEDKRSYMRMYFGTLKYNH